MNTIGGHNDSSLMRDADEAQITLMGAASFLLKALLHFPYIQTNSIHPKLTSLFMPAVP
jgi:hypothetical protein